MVGLYASVETSLVHSMNEDQYNFLLFVGKLSDHTVYWFFYAANAWKQTGEATVQFMH